MSSTKRAVAARRDLEYASGVHRSLLVLVFLAACHAPPPEPRAPAPVLPSPPVVAMPRVHEPAVPAARKPVVHEYFGTKVTDDYEWLESAQDVEVKAFTDAQNKLARTTLDALPERPKVHERVSALLSATAPDWLKIQQVAGKLFALKSTPPKPQPLLVTLDPTGKLASERVILDPGVVDPSGKTTIDFVVPSPDGKLVAVSLSSGGSESGDVHLVDVLTGKDKGETIPRVNGGTAGGSVAWNGDGTGFYYTRYPKDSEFFQQVYFHKLGTPESADVYSIGKDFPKIAEVLLLRSEDGKRILAHVANGDGGEVEHHVLENGKWIRLSHFSDEMSAAMFGPDDKIYAVSRKGAPNGKVIAFAPPYSSDRASDVAPEGTAVVDDLLVTKSALYTIEIADGPSQVRRIPLATKAEPLAHEAKKKPPVIAAGPVSALLPIPAVSNVSGAVRVGEDLLLRIESYTEAPRWMLYRASEHRLVPTALVKKAAFAMDDIAVTRSACTSTDGTSVPMTILAPKNIGKQPVPALLTGYGGFAISLKPRLRPAFRVWLDNGGVVAEANLRGGGERGEAWHRAGNLTHKQTVFDDFAACAHALVDLGYTRFDRLAITGRSNGGLLMGAALTQHPEMFRAVVSGVGIYDMLRNELSSNGAFNITEYGSVKNEAQFRALAAYSPFHAVKDGTAYPAVLFETGANDPRVDPYHSRKMTARLQVATSSERPVLLRASNDVGHGMGTPLAAEVEELTDTLTFLLHEVAPRP